MEGTGGTVNSPHISPPMPSCEKREVATDERLWNQVWVTLRVTPNKPYLGTPSLQDMGCCLMHIDTADPIL
jgi:hypothetical protein